MKLKRTNKLIPIEIIRAAVNGDQFALAYILRVYRNYIKTLSTKVITDKDGNKYICVDEDKQTILMSQLIYCITNNFKILP